MKILAVDASTTSGSVALLEGERLAAEWTFHSAIAHNRRLLSSIDSMLRRVGWSMEEMDGFAVTSGPGSFTGVRIGMSTVKTLAWALGKPFVGVPTLDALAASLAFYSGPVCAILDARKGEVYYALYRSDGKGGIVRESHYKVGAPERLAEDIHERALFCGDGWAPHRKFLLERLGALATEAPGPFHMVRAGFVAAMAFDRIIKGDVDDPMTSAPIYVRPSEAELKFPEIAAAAAVTQIKGGGL